MTRAFDRKYLVKYLGAYNYTIYDIIQNSKSSAQRVLADSNDVTIVEIYTTVNYTNPNPENFEAAKGMNECNLYIDGIIPEFLNCL